MNKENKAGTKLPNTTTETPVIGSYFEQVVFEQPSIERAREITERLLLELESRGVSIDPRTGKVTIKPSSDPSEAKG